MTMSAPSSRTKSALEPLAVVATVAPRCLASWIAIDPTPPAPAWMRTFCPGCTLPALDERLPRGQRHQRQRARLLHADRRGLERQVGLGDGDALGERADAVLVGPGVDLVAELEAAHLRADADDGAGDVVAEDQRQLVRQDLLELPGADLLVELVEPGGLHPDEHVVLPDDGLGDVRFLQRLLVLGDDERSHAMVLLLDDFLPRIPEYTQS